MANNIKSEILDTGLTLVSEHIPSSQGVSVVVLVKTGAADEKPIEAGISHFLEHMAFKGSHNRSAMEQTLALGNIGAQVNAYTSDEQTVYYGTALSEHFDKLHQLIFELASPALPEDEFNIEKNVILEEIALYMDRPTHVLYEKSVADFFAGLGVGNSVLGTTESVSAISRELMADYVGRRYKSSNIIASVSGNFSSDLLLKLSNERSNEWSDLAARLGVQVTNDIGSDASAKHRGTNLGAEGPLNFTHPKCGNQSHLLLFSKGPTASDMERYSALLVSFILGDSHNSRLYWKLVEEGLAEYVSISTDEKLSTGCIITQTSFPKNKAKEVFDIIKSELQVRTPISKDELEVAKSKLLARLVMDNELPQSRAMAHVISQQYRAEPFSLKEEIENIKNVSLKDCYEFLEQYPLSNFKAYQMGSDNL